MWLTAAEVAARLRLDVQTVRRLARAGRLPVLYPTGSRCMRFDWAAVWSACTSGTAGAFVQ